MKLVKLSLLACLLSSVASANSIYQYKGPDGVTMFTDKKQMPKEYAFVAKRTDLPPLKIEKEWSLSPPTTLSLSQRDAYDELIVSAAQAYDLEPALIKAVIHAESHFNHQAVSSAGAEGLMQLMPATAEFYNVTDSYDPQQNIFAGSEFLRYLSNRFDQLDLILAAYNAGEGNVRRYGGIPPFRETQNYVVLVQQLKKQYANHFPEVEDTVALSE
ncbi:MAG TPA: lytic transglycosylase domain-containing protein [Alcanivoracaceae bacterium]|nr:lytic transglycosylase domain-containing protein [Alcanivoracaceae bacterium]